MSDQPTPVPCSMLAMLMMGSMLGNLPPPKPKRKCLLKGCDVMTDHNGGYCCAEHFAADCGHTDKLRHSAPAEDSDNTKNI